MRENSATNVNPQPDCPLPDGACADLWEPGRVLDEDETRPWRLIYSRDRKITDHNSRVCIRAIQYSDGSLDEIDIIADGADVDGPLNSDQAREMAAALLEVAAEADRWGNGGSTSSIDDIPARQLIHELISRIGHDEVCRQLGLPLGTDLQQLATELDRVVR